MAMCLRRSAPSGRRCGVSDQAVLRAFLLERVRVALEKDIEARRNRRELETVKARYAVLTPRERQVLTRVITGMVNREVAEDLSISPKTVELHRWNLMKKMHAGSVPDLVAMCLMIDELKDPHES